ncbi:MAG: hypothetical protein CBC13_01855 [Planctomycetia bacterium TMED53]|nr:MAG: hypothetical protein CBC13_01855 [Planctomycetia bacterium TMED53]
MKPTHHLAMIGAALMVLQILVARQLATVFGNTLSGVTLAMNLGLVGLAAGLILVTLGRERRSESSHWCRITILGIIPAGLWVVYLLPLLIDGSRMHSSAALRLLLSLPLLCGAIPLGAAITASFNASRKEAEERTSRGVSALDLGSAVGAVLTPLLLLPELGSLGSFFLALLLLVACCRRVDSLEREPSELIENDQPVDHRDVFIATWIGIVTMALQLGWIRTLGEVFGSTLTIFGLTTAAILLGGAAGAQAMPGIRAKVGMDRVHRFAWALWLIMQGFSLLLLSFSPYLFLAMVQWFSGGGDSGLMWGEGLLILAVVGLPSFCVGIIVPALMLKHGETGRLDRGAGVLQGAQLIGGVIGLGLTAIWLLPAYGSLGLFLACGVLTFSGGVPFLRRSGHGTTAGAFLCGGLLLAAASQFWNSPLMSAGVFQWDRGEIARGEALPAWQQREVVAVFPGEFGNVMIEQDFAQNTSYLRVGGRIEGSVPIDPERPTLADMPTEVLLGVLPSWAGPGQGRLLVVGLGGGTTVASAVATWNGEMVVLEIEPAVKEALLSRQGALAFPVENEALRGRGAPQLVIEDARSYLVQDDRQWDAIVIQPSEPWLPWSTPLFTPDFHQLLANRRATGGVVVQWLQLYRIGIPEFAAILQSFREALGEVQIWHPPGTGEILLVAGDITRRESPDESLESAWSRVLDVPFPRQPWLDDEAVERWLESAGGGDLGLLRERLEYLLPLREEAGMDLSVSLLRSLEEARRRGLKTPVTVEKATLPDESPDEAKSGAQGETQGGVPVTPPDGG